MTLDEYLDDWFALQRTRLSRVGHRRVAMTLDVDAHVLPAMDRAAADAIGTLVRPGPRDA